MKIIVLTNNNSRYGKKLIQQIESSGISLEGIIVVNQPFSYHLKLFNYIKRRVGFFQAVFFSVHAVIKSLLAKTEQIEYSDFSSKLFYTKGNNSEETEQLLKELNIDIVVLGQTGIIRKNIIETANVGILNAHPGILPSYRGIDCLKWAVFNNDLSKIGSSVHWVDVGVDTGGIISTRQYELKSKTSSDELEWDLYLQCIDDLVVALKDIQDGKKSQFQAQEISDGKQYFKMPLFKVLKTYKKINKMSS